MILENLGWFKTKIMPNLFFFKYFREYMHINSIAEKLKIHSYRSKKMKKKKMENCFHSINFAAWNLWSKIFILNINFAYIIHPSWNERNNIIDERSHPIEKQMIHNNLINNGSMKSYRVYSYIIICYGKGKKMPRILILSM